MENNWNDLEHEVAKRVAQPGKVGKVIENLGKLGLAGIGAVAIGGCNNPTGSRGPVEPPVQLTHAEIEAKGLAFKEYCLANHRSKYDQKLKDHWTANGMIRYIPKGSALWEEQAAMLHKNCILGHMADLAGNRNFEGSITSYLKGLEGGSAPVIQGPKIINDFYVWETESANPRFRVNDFHTERYDNVGTAQGLRRTMTHRRLEHEHSVPPPSRQNFNEISGR